MGETRGSHYPYLGRFFRPDTAGYFCRGTVTLAWDPSPGTNVIANYNVYYGVASATYTNVAAAGANTTVSISNLVEGATYYFAATAVDTSGLESDYSTEVSTLIPISYQPAAHAECAGQRHHQRGCRPADRQPLRHHLRCDQRVPDPHRHRLFEQHGPDPDSHGHLHQPQRHRFDQLHPGRLCLWLRHHHRHGQ